jgi:ubiquinone/menaquinone biosynthesis C-methylase UbiE
VGIRASELRREASAGVESVASHYRGSGWLEQDGVTLDAELNEDLRACARWYVSACRRRVKEELPERGGRILDMASGPIQYEEYLEYSQGFQTRVCVDFSKKALVMAKEKIGEDGEYHCGDFLAMSFPANSLDAAVSLHTLYHMDLGCQEVAVRKMVDMLKPGSVLVIVYKNPREWSRPLIDGMKFLTLWVKKWIFPMESEGQKREQQVDIYHAAHPLEWWSRFQDVAELRYRPWRSFSARHQKFLFPDSKLGAWMFSKLFKLEELFPQFFLRHFKFPMIILKKRS